MRPLLIILFTSLWISPQAFAWGELGHRLIAQYGTQLADPKTLINCRVTAPQLVEHTNDPDKIWRQQRFAHPHEAEMHFLHVDRQPQDWRRRDEAKDTSQGRLVYHIIDWIDEAKRLRKAGKWNDLAEKLYGLSHYLGDLTQPLHLNHDYDGEEAGLPDIHAQFETKMLNRFERETRIGVEAELARQKIPAEWSELTIRRLIFDVAEQSNAKTTRLFRDARVALSVPHQSRHRKAKRQPEPRFEKKVLWQNTGELAVHQLATGARLWAYVLNDVCR